MSRRPNTSSIAEHAEHAAHSGDSFLSTVSVTIAILAVIAAMVGSVENIESGSAISAKNESVLLQNRTTDTWAFFQANSIKKNLFDIAAAAGGPKADEYSAKSQDYQKQQDEARADANKLEHERDEKLAESDHHEHRHHILTIGVTMIHVAIAIATVSIIMRGRRWPWHASMILGGDRHRGGRRSLPGLTEDDADEGQPPAAFRRALHWLRYFGQVIPGVCAVKVALLAFHSLPHWRSRATNAVRPALMGFAPGAGAAGAVAVVVGVAGAVVAGAGAGTAAGFGLSGLAAVVAVGAAVAAAGVTGGAAVADAGCAFSFAEQSDRNWFHVIPFSVPAALAA